MVWEEMIRLVEEREEYVRLFRIQYVNTVYALGHYYMSEKQYLLGKKVLWGYLRRRLREVLPYELSVN